MFTTISQKVNFLMINIFQEGGPLFMYTSLICLIIILALLIKELIKKDDREKTIKLVNSVSLFVLVWGFLGQIIGLMGALDSIQSMDSNIATPVLAAGLKVGILSPMFGMVVFLIARVGIILLIATKKK